MKGETEMKDALATAIRETLIRHDLKGEDKEGMPTNLVEVLDYAFAILEHAEAVQELAKALRPEKPKDDPDPAGNHTTMMGPNNRSH